jgi:hypothetical protein
VTEEDLRAQRGMDCHLMSPGWEIDQARDFTLSIALKALESPRWAPSCCSHLTEDAQELKETMEFAKEHQQGSRAGI